MCATLGYNHTNVKLSPFKFNSQKEAAMGTVYRLTPNMAHIIWVNLWAMNPKFELGWFKWILFKMV